MGGTSPGEGPRRALDRAYAMRVAEDIDRLITLDINRRGVIGILYDAARERIGAPLVYAAADRLLETLGPGSTVIIATGWPDRPWISPSIGELDGPPGAALLARSLHDALGAVPIFAVENQLIPAMSATATAAGFAVLGPDEAVAAAESPAPLHSAAVVGFPTDKAEAVVASRKLVEHLEPGAVVAVEKGSANDKGVIHNARGMDNTESIAKVDELVRLSKEIGTPTLGIGDGGNEVGMGLISDTIREHVRYGKVCACPCGSGIAPELETDVLVASTVSNWGAYGVAACLAAIVGDAKAFHEPATERRTLREAADAGLIDGNTGYVTPGADGLSVDIHAAIVTLLGQIVSNALAPKGLAMQSTFPGGNRGP